MISCSVHPDSLGLHWLDDADHGSHLVDASQNYPILWVGCFTIISRSTNVPRYHDMSSKHGLSNIGYCFFICFGSLMQQGSTTVPAADSGWKISVHDLLHILFSDESWLASGGCLWLWRWPPTAETLLLSWPSPPSSTPSPTSTPSWRRLVMAQDFSTHPWPPRGRTRRSPGVSLVDLSLKTTLRMQRKRNSGSLPKFTCFKNWLSYNNVNAFLFRHIAEQAVKHKEADTVPSG